MAFEAMNHAGDVHPDMLVILNDNDMSISENVGALNNHLAQVLIGQSIHVNCVKAVRKSYPVLPPIKELVRRTEEHLKGMVEFLVPCLKSLALTTSALLMVTMLTYVGQIR